MENIANSFSQTAKAVWGTKKAFIYAILLMLSTSWTYTALSFCIDEDLLIILPFFVVLSLIILGVSFFATLNLEISVFQGTAPQTGSVSGKYFFGQIFSLPVSSIQSVQHSGINGIKIVCHNKKTYNFSFIENRDELCLAMRKAGVAVAAGLAKDEKATISSESNNKKSNLCKILAAVFLILSNISISISAIWFNSPSNYYTYKSTHYYYYYGYRIPYQIPERRIDFWPEEMPTTYIALAFLLAFLVCVIINIIRANNKASVSPGFFRGVDSFGKAIYVPVGQITSAIANPTSITINCTGKTYRYYWITNGALICGFINDIKTGKYANAPFMANWNNTAADNVTPTVPNNTAAPVAPVTVANTPETAEAPHTSEASQVVEEPKTVEAPQAADTEVTEKINLAEEIMQLKDLLDKGLITEEEFETKKKQILGL